MMTDDQNDTPRQTNNPSKDTLHFDTLITALDETTSRRRALELLAGSAFGGMLVQQSIGNISAQETQPADEECPADGLEKLVQFVHPEKVYGFLPGLDEERLASLFYPDSPNDIVPRRYNDPEPMAGLPTSLLPPPVHPRGLEWSYSEARSGASARFS